MERVPSEGESIENIFLKGKQNIAKVFFDDRNLPAVTGIVKLQ